MFAQIVDRGIRPKNNYKLFVATKTKNDNEHADGAVSHMVGSDEVTVRSNQPGWGSVPVSGREDLALMRDALIEICKMENIP